MSISRDWFSLQRWLTWTTEQSGHLVDFGRFASHPRKALSKGLHYTKHQACVVTAMWLAMFAGAAVGAYTADNENPNTLTAWKRAGIGFITLFIITHAIVTVPRVYKRCNRKIRIGSLAESILWLLDNARVLTKAENLNCLSRPHAERIERIVIELTRQIQTYSLTTPTNSAARVTLRTQERMMQSLSKQFTKDITDVLDGRLTSEVMIQKLQRLNIESLVPPHMRRRDSQYNTHELRRSLGPG